MSVWISLQTRDYKDHPDWVGGLAGDREFADGMYDLDGATALDDRGEETGLTRPLDFGLWRSWVAAQNWLNPGRFEQLLDLLEADHRYWISVGR